MGVGVGISLVGLSFKNRLESALNLVDVAKLFDVDLSVRHPEFFGRATHRVSTSPTAGDVHDVSEGCWVVSVVADVAREFGARFTSLVAEAKMTRSAFSGTRTPFT